VACNDPKNREFRDITAGAKYELSVTGPAGFAAFAQFDNEATTTIETWPSADITPGPKKKTLGSPGSVHLVFVFVNISTTKNIDVTVEATVDGKTYCRTVSGTAPRKEIIVHTLRMKS
jgi:hypothetical protein